MNFGDEREDLLCSIDFRIESIENSEEAILSRIAIKIDIFLCSYSGNDGHLRSVSSVFSDISSGRHSICAKDNCNGDYLVSSMTD